MRCPRTFPPRASTTSLSGSRARSARRLPLRPPRHARDRARQTRSRSWRRRPPRKADALRRRRPARARRAGRIVLRVGDLDAALAAPRDVSVERDGEVAASRRPRASPSAWSSARPTSTTTSTTSCSGQRPRCAPAWLRRARLRAADDGLAVDDRSCGWSRGGAARGRAPAAQPPGAARGLGGRGRAEAGERGLEIAEVKDAANTLAVFVGGPIASRSSTSSTSRASRSST